MSDTRLRGSGYHGDVRAKHSRLHLPCLGISEKDVQAMTTLAAPSALPVVVREPRVVHVRELPGSLHLFTCLSFSRALMRHEGAIDLETGRVLCSCEDFWFRHGMWEPLWTDTEHLCCHAHLWLQWLDKRHLLASAPFLLRPCRLCGCVGAEYEMMAADGTLTEGAFVCAGCVERAGRDTI